MSIRWVRTATANNAKLPQAIGWAKEVSAFAEKKFGISGIRVSMAVTGAVGLMRWEIDYPDIATFQEKFSAVLTDQEYWAMINKAFDDELFVPNSTTDEIYQQL